MDVRSTITINYIERFVPYKLTNMIQQLPFTGRRQDPVFVAARQALEAQGVKLPLEQVHVIFIYVRGHFLHALEHYGPFWKGWKDSDVIDVATPARSFYPLLQSRMKASPEFAEENVDEATFWHVVKMGEQMTVVLNYFFNYLIRYLQAQANPVLVRV